MKSFTNARNSLRFRAHNLVLLFCTIPASLQFVAALSIDYMRITNSLWKVHAVQFPASSTRFIFDLRVIISKDIILYEYSLIICSLFLLCLCNHSRHHWLQEFTHETMCGFCIAH